ncbi:hypothetical protein A8F94_08765 [Bacillus sp. FJAT-27225]|uniref:hypothetical protein n=1 Tax=Bacillus sp. FJAT-27225 TaxID=1743144 RepID=UPI00080C2EAF|nr:hypothetical protein [Bacillus sp. FJAT-27225]OCA87913.1 hypothetical protein A8F94_08765 [Bacillus sp. FJAT-27225]
MNILKFLKTLALIIFGFIRFIVMFVSLFASVWFFVVAIFSVIVAIGGDQSDWMYALRQYLYFVGCSVVLGVTNDIEEKINGDPYDYPLGCLIEWYILLMFAHYELLKKIVMKIVNIFRPNPEA